jgi:hypothetical protein
MGKILTDKNWQPAEKVLLESGGQHTGRGEPKSPAKVDEVRIDLETGTVTLRITGAGVEHH